MTFCSVMSIRSTGWAMSDAKPDWEALGRVFAGLGGSPSATEVRKCRGTASESAWADPELAMEIAEERAAIMEYGGRVSRATAEAYAFRGLVRRGRFFCLKE